MNPTLFKIFEYVYLGIAVFFGISAFYEWETDRNKSYLYMLMAGIAVLLFFFRRTYRKRFERYKDNDKK